MTIPREKWEWYGSPAHHICGQWCRFHLATKVGDYLISTIGEYVHPRHSGGSEQGEAEWLKENWPGEDIGYGRKYETRVFKLGNKTCPCGCGLPRPLDWCEIDSKGYNDAASAREGHLVLCEKYSKKNIRSQS